MYVMYIHHRMCIMAEVAEMDRQVAIEGRVERVIFHKNNFAIFTTEKDLLQPSYTVKGEVHSIRPGMTVTVSGEFVDDERYGRQIKAKSIFPAVLASNATFDSEAFAEYLGSGIIPGVGIVRARRIVEHFGARVESVLRDSPADLAQVAGISAQLAASIGAHWMKSLAVHDLFRFLSSHGLTLLKSSNIYDELGPGSLSAIRANPYILCKVDGIGFKTADSVAESVGIARDSADRIREGVRYYFEEEIIKGKGSTGAPYIVVANGAAKLLGVPLVLVVGVLDDEIASGRLIADEQENVFYPPAYFAEKKIASDLVRLYRPFNNDPEALLEKILQAEKECGLAFPLSDSQRAAIIKMMSGSVSVLTGQPGTGKTTILRVFLHMMGEHRIALCAPAGKAAKRMEEATGLPASTIHRLLATQSDGSFEYNKGNPLEADLVCIDEMSMSDVYIVSSLLEALPPHCKVLLVGDTHQLPSVGAGRVLGDIIDSGVVPVAALTEIRRQGEGSGIIMAAKRINAGACPEFSHSEGDFPVHKIDDPEKAAEHIVHLVSKELPGRGIPHDDIQVLAPAKSGACGVNALNARLQEALNPNINIDSRCIQVIDRKIALNDRVIQTKNDYDRGIFNGDTGKVVRVDPDRGEVDVDFAGVGVVTIAPEVLSRLELFYAGTIHKSQGSEFKHVVMPMYMQAYMMLKRNLLYTGVTRGKECVHMVTDSSLKAIERAVKTEDANTRITSLAGHIRDRFMLTSQQEPAALAAHP